MLSCLLNRDRVTLPLKYLASQTRSGCHCPLSKVRGHLLKKDRVTLLLKQVSNKVCGCFQVLSLVVGYARHETPQQTWHKRQATDYIIYDHVAANNITHPTCRKGRNVYHNKRSLQWNIFKTQVLKLNLKRITLALIHLTFPKSCQSIIMYSNYHL